MKKVHKIFSVLAVGAIVVAFAASLALAGTGNPADVSEASTRYVVGTGSVTKLDTYMILDSNGQDWYAVDVDEEYQKVGLEVYYAGYASGNVLELTYLEPIYFEYTPVDSHGRGIIRAAGTGDGFNVGD